MGLKKATLWALSGAAATVGTMVVLQKKRHFDLTNRVVLITGGSRGFGLLLAQEFASRGARVAICARDGEELERGRRYLQQFGLDARAFVCDVTQKAQIEHLVEEVERELGSVEVLVNNAGVISMGPVDAMTDEDMKASIDTHIWAAWHACNAVLPAMRARASGRILNISSIGGRVSVPHLTPYAVGKFGLAGLSQGLRIELAQYGVLVTTAFPFPMRVGSFINATMKGQHRKEFALGQIVDSNPLLSQNPERAARNVVEAVIRGDSYIVPSNRGQLAITLAAVFPGLALEATSLLGRFMPSKDGPESIGSAGVKGKDSESVFAPSVLTVLNDKAARELNEL